MHFIEMQVITAQIRQRLFSGLICRIIYANPADKLMKVLEENTDALYMYLNCLPDDV